MKGTSNKWMHEEINKNNLCLNKNPLSEISLKFDYLRGTPDKSMLGLHGIFQTWDLDSTTLAAG